MEKQAAEKLGEDVQAGVIVQPAGTGRATMMAGVGGIAGGLAAGALTSGGDASAILGHKGLMYLAVGPTKVGFFKLKQGLLKNSVGDMLGILRRDGVTSMVMGGGTLTSSVTVALADGSTLALEVPRVHKGKAERVVALFQTLPG